MNILSFWCGFYIGVVFGAWVAYKALAAWEEDKE